MNLQVSRQQQHVDELQARGRDLKEMMANMERASERQLLGATRESDRIRSLFAGTDAQLRKARARKASLDAKAGSERKAWAPPEAKKESLESLKSLEAAHASCFGAQNRQFFCLASRHEPLRPALQAGAGG